MTPSLQICTVAMHILASMCTIRAVYAVLHPTHTDGCAAWLRCSPAAQRSAMLGLRADNHVPVTVRSTP